MPVANDTRRVVRVADHRVAARHDAVVKGLERAALVIDAVVGRHEAALRSLGGEKRAPSRRPASRVNDTDAALPDDARQPQRVEHNHRGVFRLGRKPDQFPAPSASSFSSLPPEDTTSASPPPSVTASAISIVVRSAPPVESSGTTWRTTGQGLLFNISARQNVRVRPCSGTNDGRT